MILDTRYSSIVIDFSDSFYIYIDAPVSVLSMCVRALVYRVCMYLASRTCVDFKTG